MIIRLAISAGLAVGFLMPIDVQGPDITPAPAKDCVMAVDANGDGDWYCGHTINPPAGSYIVAPGMPACAEEDGSGGPVPCRWDPATAGNHKGGPAYTVLLEPHALYFRYDNGVTVLVDN